MIGKHVGSSFINLNLRENNYARAYIICSNHQNLSLYLGSGIFPVFPDGVLQRSGSVGLAHHVGRVRSPIPFSVRRTISQLSWSL